MKRVLVLGHSPSKLGGKSPTLKRLNMWMDQLGIHFYSFANLYPDGKKQLSHKEVLELASGSLIICLGSNVSGTIYGYYCHYPDFRVKWVSMDHPSPLNRNLNSSSYVASMLKEVSQAVRLFL